MRPEPSSSIDQYGVSIRPLGHAARRPRTRLPRPAATPRSRSAGTPSTNVTTPSVDALATARSRPGSPSAAPRTRPTRYGAGLNTTTESPRQPDARRQSVERFVEHALTDLRQPRVIRFGVAYTAEMADPAGCRETDSSGSAASPRRAPRADTPNQATRAPSPRTARPRDTAAATAHCAAFAAPDRCTCRGGTRGTARHPRPGTSSPLGQLFVESREELVGAAHPDPREPGQIDQPPARLDHVQRRPAAAIAVAKRHQQFAAAARGPESASTRRA